MLELLLPTLLKYLGVAGIVLAILFGIYEQGHHNGYDSGYAAAQKADSVTINSLKDTIKNDRDAVAAKAKIVVADSNADAAKIEKTTSANTSKVQAIAQKYTPKTQPPSISAGCNDHVDVDDLSWIINGVNEQIDATFGDSK